MAQHFVTVCVVCVLCAAHTPCSAHMDLSLPQYAFSNSKYNIHLLNYTEQLSTSDSDLKNHENDEDIQILYIDNAQKQNNDVKYTFSKNTDEDDTKQYHVDKTFQMRKLSEENDSDVHLNHERLSSLKDIKIMTRLGQIQDKDLKLPKDYDNNITKKLRIKRHTGVDDKYFLRKLFNMYGDGTSMTMDGFEKLLKNLKLHRLIAEFEEQDDHNIVNNRAGNIKDLRSNSNSHDIDKSKGTKQKCLSSKELLSTLSQDSSYETSNTTLPSWLFERVCPALVYQLVGESASERDGCVQIPESNKIFIADDYDTEEMSHNMVQVWIYSSISILIISLCGLLGVAVIPVMGKSYYNQLLQFLVALAVGSLCGDALIHLLPHAMMSHSEHMHSHESSSSHVNHEDAHNANMWKGFAAMIGLVLFFFTEKALNMFTEWRKHLQRRKKLPTRVKVMRETDGGSNNIVGEKLCKHKYSPYPYCYGEIATENQDNHNHQHNHKLPPAIEEEKPLTSNCNSVSKIMDNELEKKETDDWKLDDTIMNSKKNIDGSDLNESESYTVIIREHETKHHGHTHSHGHVHSAPDSMSSVAWMVVMGDGLHNFTDGMAIGAAFSANIAGGFSTAIAVFCHELPHELGDFAVLLKAGMSAKQAVFYNLLSSVLCLFGMVFGVLLGGTPTASSWMFAAAAGMFIYIALVDMIPELSSNHSTESGCQWQCILQALGLISGLSIMLIIALYEHDLKHIFSE